MNLIRKVNVVSLRNVLSRFVTIARRMLVGIYRMCIALVLVVLSLPIFWLVDYDKLTIFVVKHGVMFGVLLSWIAAGLLWWNFHPIRAVGVVGLAMVMTVIEDPKAFFE